MALDKLLKALDEDFSLLAPVDGLLVNALELVEASRKELNSFLNVLWHFMPALSQGVEGQHVSNSCNSLVLGLLKLLLVVLLHLLGRRLEVSKLSLEALNFIFNFRSCSNFLLLLVSGFEILALGFVTELVDLSQFLLLVPDLLGDLDFEGCQVGGALR